MPTVFNEDGYRGMVFPNDHDPVHVHVYKNELSIKINVITLEVIDLEGGRPKPKEVKKALRLAEKHRRKIEEKWAELHD